MTNSPIYGYRKVPDTNQWVIDEEAAAIVRRIYRMSLDGMGPYRIARKLTEDKVEKPSYYAVKHGIAGVKSKRHGRQEPYIWCGSTVTGILSRLEYCGHTVNFRTSKASYKDKGYRRNDPDNWKIFEHTHAPVIDRETFDSVQRLKGTPRRIDTTGEANPLTGLVFCADCGAKLYNSRRSKTPADKRCVSGKVYTCVESDLYTCSTYNMGRKRFKETCTMHYIRTVVLRELVLDAIRRVSGYVRENEADFVEKVRKASVANTNNPHVHILYNSVNLDRDRKFQDFKRSAIALRRVSDRICLEHGLSVIENPGLSKGHNRSEYLGTGTRKRVSVRDKLRDMIDSHLVKGTDFEDLIAALKKAGCEVKLGKHLAIKVPGGQRFIRLISLGDDYLEDALMERLSGKRVVASKKKAPAPSALPSIQRPNLLIDIQAKLQQAHSPGFEHFALLHNLKAMAKTLILLQDWGLASYDALSEKAEAVVKSFNERSDKIKGIEARQKEISELQRHIGTYSKTKDVLDEYNRLKNAKPSAFAKLSNTQSPADKFYKENADKIIHCNAAKRYFDEQGYGRGTGKKLPTFQSLRAEYAKLEAEKKKLWSGYKPEREEMIALQMAKQNVDMFLGEPRQPSRSHERNER